MQESLTLSSTATLPAANPAAQVEHVPLSVIEADIQALRTLVHTQQSQLKTLQSLKESQPLVGLTTDSPWGMAMEGLVLGLVALAFGALLLIGARTALPGRLGMGPGARPKPPLPATEFSDSMLYLAGHEEAVDSVPGVSTHLHDPQQDAKASTLAHEDGDPELEYYRMALTAQGLSVTAGAGHVDSDRVPLEPAYPAASAEKAAGSVFSPTLSKVEFDQRAAAEEVERVRRYLAQRRADRAKNALLSDMGVSSAPAAPAHVEAQADTMPQSVDIALDVQWPSEPVATLSPEVADSATGQDDPLPLTQGLEHMSLADGASLLVALEDAGQVTPAQAEPQAPVSDGAMLEWDPNLLADAKHSPRDALEEVDTPPLLGAPVQLALAQEFRDLGLWEEARARVLEILEQPDTGHHAQARALLEELAQTASAPLAPNSPDSEDPWGH